MIITAKGRWTRGQAGHTFYLPPAVERKLGIDINGSWNWKKGIKYNPKTGELYAKMREIPSIEPRRIGVSKYGRSAAHAIDVCNATYRAKADEVRRTLVETDLIFDDEKRILEIKAGPVTNESDEAAINFADDENSFAQLLLEFLQDRGLMQRFEDYVVGRERPENAGWFEQELEKFRKAIY